MELPPGARPVVADRRRAALIAWAAALLALLPHLRGLANGFVYDDFRFVAENAGVHSLAEPTALFTDIGRMSSPRDTDIWRPLRTAGFALQHALVCPAGDVPHACAASTAWLYHAVSLLLFLLLTRGLIGLAQSGAGFSLGAACAGALLFGVHPLTVESVAWISSQGDLLAATAAVGALALAPLGTAVATAAAATLAALALLGKESALPLVALLACAWWRDRRNKAVPRTCGALVIAVAGLTVAYLLARQHVLGRSLDLSPNGFSQIEAPFAARVAATLRHALFAVRLIAWPWPPSIDYDAASIEPDAHWIPAGLMLAGCALLVAAGSRARARWLAPALFAAAFFAPSCGLLVVMKSPTADRFLLLPTAGVAFALAGAAATVFAGASARQRCARMLLAAAALPLAAATCARTGDFTADAKLWGAELRHHSRSLQALLGMLHDAAEHGDDDASLHFAGRLVAAAQDDDPRGWLGRLYLGQFAVDRGDDKVAATEFEAVRRALATRGHAYGTPADVHLVFVGLANLARKQGDPARAKQLAREGLRWFGREPRLLEALGVALDLEGDATGAVATHREALASGWESASLHFHLALAERHRGALALARAAAERALALDPQHAGALELIRELSP